MGPTVEKDSDADLPTKETMEDIKRSTLVEHADPATGVLRCFVCVAKAEVVGSNNSAFGALCHTYSRQGSLARHFITAHLDGVASDASTECTSCRVTLLHKKHLQNHALLVHGINTNIKFKRPVQRRVF